MRVKFDVRVSKHHWSFTFKRTRRTPGHVTYGFDASWLVKARETAPRVKASCSRWEGKEAAETTRKLDVRVPRTAKGVFTTYTHRTGVGTVW